MKFVHDFSFIRRLRFALSPLFLIYSSLLQTLRTFNCRLKVRKSASSVIILMMGIWTCSAPKLDDQTVAIVSNQRVSVDDLIMSYELLPGWASSKKGKEALAAHLDLLIEKKLFALEGQRLGYHRDPEVQRVVNWIRNDELRKALYRAEIEEKIEITEADLRSAYQKQKLQFHTRHLFARTESEIQTIQQALAQGVAWEEIANTSFSDSSLAKSGGDLGWIGFGQMDPVFEDTLYTLPVGRISQPVRSRYGYHLIQVLNMRQNIFAAEEEFQAQKQRLENALRRSEENKRANVYIKQFMAEKDVKMINRTFDLLVAEIRDNVIDIRSVDQLNLPQIKDGELSQLSDGLEEHLNDILITFKGGQWTLKDFLTKLYQIPAPKRPRLTHPIKFRDDLGILIRDDFLTQAARARGLEKDPIAQKEVNHWEDEYTFSRLWKSIEDTITVSDRQARDFYQQHVARYWWPEQVQVQEILVTDRSQALDILAQLRRGADFQELAKKKSLRKTVAQNGGHLGWIALGQLGNISQVAFQLKMGQVSDPIQVEGGFSLIKVLGRQAQKYKTFEEAQDQVTADVRRQLRKTVYDQWIKKLKKRTRSQINDSLLSSLAKAMKTSEPAIMPGMRPVYK